MADILFLPGNLKPELFELRQQFGDHFHPSLRPTILSSTMMLRRFLSASTGVPSAASTRTFKASLGEGHLNVFPSPQRFRPQPAHGSS
jgi:hypothetical protein